MIVYPSIRQWVPQSPTNELLVVEFFGPNDGTVIEAKNSKRVVGTHLKYWRHIEDKHADGTPFWMEVLDGEE